MPGNPSGAYDRLVLHVFAVLGICLVAWNLWMWFGLLDVALAINGISGVYLLILLVVWCWRGRRRATEETTG